VSAIFTAIVAFMLVAILHAALLQRTASAGAFSALEGLVDSPRSEAYGHGNDDHHSNGLHLCG